jgi:predicted RND superfamily exporter protein
MVFASVKSVVFFGVLLSFTIITALFCELTIFPAQICLLRRFLASDFAAEKVDGENSDDTSDDEVNTNKS